VQHEVLDWPSSPTSNQPAPAPVQPTKSILFQRELDLARQHHGRRPGQAGQPGSSLARRLRTIAPCRPSKLVWIDFPYDRIGEIASLAQGIDEKKRQPRSVGSLAGRCMARNQAELFQIRHHVRTEAGDSAPAIRREMLGSRSPGLAGAQG